MAKINNNKRRILIGLAAVLLAVTTTITVRQFYVKNLKLVAAAQTERDLAAAKSVAALAELQKEKLAREKIQADKEKVETERQLALAEVEKAHIEQELLSAERQLVNDRHREIKALLESTSQAVAVVTQDHKIAKWSRGAEKIFGWTYDEVVGKDADFLMPTEMFNRHRAGFGKAMTNQAAQVVAGVGDVGPGDDEHASTVVIQCVAKHKDGSDVVVIITVRMFLAGGKPHAFAAFDLADSVKYIDARPGAN
jgi:PAS domain-containing protein